MATHRHGSTRPGHRDPSRQQRHHTDERPERKLREDRNRVGVALSCLEAGAVVLARIPFAETHDSKIRPAIVVHASKDAVIVRPVTTSVGMRRRAGIVREIVLDRRRCWVIDRLVRIPLASVVKMVSAPGAGLERSAA